MAANNPDIFFTLKGASESLFKDKGSKHYGFAQPVSNKEEIDNIIDNLRKAHHSARHVAYAWTLGDTNSIEKSSDDGEPHNSAGPPILGQIHAFHLKNVLICVVRYFGGTKLGVSGLINAYKTTAKEAIENNTILSKVRTKLLKVNFRYEDMNDVQRIAKMPGNNIVSQTFEQACEMIIAAPRSKFDEVFVRFQNIHTLEVTEFTV